jgi:hypothetical protein
MRKYWMREYLIYGENFIDKLRYTSIDPSTIIDIICEGYDEHIDDVLYYQQMFQTATQMYAGIKVPESRSRDSTTGKYIVRQIPADQIIHIKATWSASRSAGAPSSTRSWAGSSASPTPSTRRSWASSCAPPSSGTTPSTAARTPWTAHAAKYNYIPVAPSIFVHNKTVERKPLAPMASVTAGQSNVVQELIAYVATAIGLAKDQLNVFASGGGNRATAIVGSEPFTKVIEDLQEDGSDLLHQIIESFCEQAGFDYDPDEWEVIFPSVQKDALNDRLKAIATCESMGWFNHERAATMAASEMEADSYVYDDEMKKDADDRQKRLAAGIPGFGATPPAGTLWRSGAARPAARRRRQQPHPRQGQGEDRRSAQEPVTARAKFCACANEPKPTKGAKVYIKRRGVLTLNKHETKDFAEPIGTMRYYTVGDQKVLALFLDPSRAARPGGPGVSRLVLALLVVAPMMAGCVATGPSRAQYANLLRECRELNREHLRLLKEYERRHCEGNPEQMHGAAEMGLGGLLNARRHRGVRGRRHRLRLCRRPPVRRGRRHRPHGLAARVRLGDESYPVIACAGVQIVAGAYWVCPGVAKYHVRLGIIRAFPLCAAHEALWTHGRGVKVLADGGMVLDLVPRNPPPHPDVEHPLPR